MSQELLKATGITASPRYVADVSGSEDPAKGVVCVENPATGEPICGIRLDTPESYEQTVVEAVESFKAWREVPAPQRGQIVRAIGEELRAHRDDLGALISLEMGKIRAEGIGEVQETIDIADFAVGLSRQVGGPVVPSERPLHRMYEQWLPLGPIGIITAFNFPNAVWGWNAMLGAVCGDVMIWKPSLLSPLSAVAASAIADRVATNLGHPGVFRLVIGTDDAIGERMVDDKRLPLISATGSCRMGRVVGQRVAARLGRSLLELGGNNATIVEPDADLDLALKYTVFGSVGTAGQRCTTNRRLIIHESIADGFLDKLVSAYKSVSIGDPLADGTLVGPLINEQSVEAFLAAIKSAKDQGAEVLVGGDRASVSGRDGGHYVQPTVIRAPSSNVLPVAMDETFAPILYVFTYKTFEEAIALQNSVDQGLSSAIFTDSVRTSEKFLAVSGSGSDCGLAYVNLGTSGAEIGGAFGGEKDTGGGRESGSDAWKAYMRRQTCSINYGSAFQLAQGIRFE